MLKIIFVLVGTFVGAGFASGKEIFNFFTIYGNASFFSILIFSFLFFMLIYRCLKIKLEQNITSYNQFLVYLEEKYRFFHHRSFLWIIHLFLASSFYIMVVALSSLFQSQLHVAKWITISIIIFICYFIFYKKNIRFIYTINSILMPLLICFMVSLCCFHIYHLQSIEAITFKSPFPFWISIGAGLLYFSYNSLLVIPILFNLEIQGNKKLNFRIAFFYSLIIFLITFLVNLLLMNFYNLVASVEMPILTICNLFSNFFSFFYFFIILSAIFTTIISSGFSFVNDLKSKHFTLKLILFLCASFVFCYFSFSSLINFFYPLFGLIGLLQIFLIFVVKT